MHPTEDGMKLIRNLSIQKKLVIIIMLTSSATLLFASGAFLVRDVLVFHHSLINNMSGLTQVIGMNSEGALVFNDRQTANDNLSALRTLPYVTHASIFDRNGNEFATYHRKNSKSTVSHLKKGTHYYKSVGGSEYLFLTQPIHSFNEMVGTVLIQYDVDEIIEKMREVGFIFVGIMILSFFVALLLSHRLQRVISSPILKLAHTAKVISSHKDYSVRAERDEDHNDEIGTLIDGFNEMIREVESREKELKQRKEMEIQQSRRYLEA